MRAIIIDDEVNGMELLTSLLKDNCEQVKLVGQESDAQKALALVERERPDLVFLDIEMPEMSGFEFLEKLKHLSFHVIFTTAYDQYALKAFKYNTIDYLLKPIIVSELVAAVKKFETQNGSQHISIADLLKSIKNIPNKEKLAISSQSEIVYVEIADIIRLESDSNYTHFILRGGKKITASKTMKEYEGILDPGTFFRTHKTFIVNLNYVDKFVKADGGYIVMKDGGEVPVSRERRQELVNILAGR